MSTVPLHVIQLDVVMPLPRAQLVRRAVRLEQLSVGWSVIEGVVALAAALAAGSVVLLGFGVDSFVESASAGVMLWRLASERVGRSTEEVERVEDRARRLTAASLLALAVYVALDAAHALLTVERPRFSPAGAALLLVSMGLMMWLARAKRRTAAALHSRALAADAFQTTACWWLSAIALVGLGLNALLGWWWADPVAAMGAAALIAREGWRTWLGEETCCSPRLALAGHRHGAHERHEYATKEMTDALGPVLAG